MKKSLPFNIPFLSYLGTTFTSCFTSTFMFLENITGNDDYECKKRDGQSCDECGNCHNTTNTLLERIFFLFDTMSGKSSLRCRFDGALTEMQKMLCVDGDTDVNIIKFLFDFTSYEYQKLTDPGEFKSAIIDSINADRPIIAKVRLGDDNFRVITGYDNDTIICADFIGVQNKPETVPTYDEFESLHIFGKKFKPSYSPLENGLKRIEKVMDYNINACLWDEYIEKLRYWGDKRLCEQELHEIQRRFKRTVETMWFTFNCHSFGETFRHCIYGEMSDPVFTDSWTHINFACDDMHTRAWSIIELEKIINWENRPEWGLCEIMPLIIEKMKLNDIKVLNAIKHAWEISRTKRDTKPILIP